MFLMFMCVDAMLLSQSYQYPNLLDGADGIGGQLLGDRVPLQWLNPFWQGLEEGAGKQCLERALPNISSTSVQASMRELLWPSGKALGW